MARNDKKQRTVMKTTTGLTVTASRANAAPVFTLQPSGTVSFTQGNAGQQDVNFAATDPNNDPITFYLVGTPPSGVTYAFFTGFIRFSYTSGGTPGSVNLRIAADDGFGNVTQSTQFTVQLVVASVSWSGTPVVSFIANQISTVSITPYLVNYSAATDVITITSGVLPASGWCTFNGTAFSSNGTQVDADDFGPIRLGVSRSGGPVVNSALFNVTVTPAISLPTNSIYTDYGDSYNSMDGRRFNLSHGQMPLSGSPATGCPWKNLGGDWKDKNGVEQGTAPFVSATATSGGGNLVFSGTGMRDLAQLWVTRNVGAFLIPENNPVTGFYFSSRTGTNPPTLQIIAAGITYNCSCRASTFFFANGGGTGRTFPNLYDAEILVSPGSGTRELVQFDLSAVPKSATVTSATMTLRITQPPGASGCRVDAYNVNWPRISIDPKNDAGIPPTTGGIAENYDWDVGIESHPDVIFAGDFSAGFAQKWIMSNPNTKPLENDSAFWTFRYAGDPLYPRSIQYSSETADVVWPGRPGAVPDSKGESKHFYYQSTPGGPVANDSRFGGRTSLESYYLLEKDADTRSASGSTGQYGSDGRVRLLCNHWFSAYNLNSPMSAQPKKVYFRCMIMLKGDPVGNQGCKFGGAIDYKSGMMKDGVWSRESQQAPAGVPPKGQWVPEYGHPKQSYPIGTLTATIGGWPRNGVKLHTLNSDFGGIYWIDPKIGNVSTRALVPGYTPGQQGLVDSDANGEVLLTQIQNWDGVTYDTQGHPKQSYPAGTTSAVLGGWHPLAERAMPMDGVDNGYFTAGTFSCRGKSAGQTFDTHNGYLWADINGEISLTGIQYDSGGGTWVNGTPEAWTTATVIPHPEGRRFWRMGTGEAWTTATAVPHDMTTGQNSGDYGPLVNNSMNYRNGVPGKFFGGSARMEYVCFYTPQVEMRAWAQGSGIRITLSYPNVANVFQTGDKFWLHVQTPQHAQYTYNGPNLSSNSAGEFVLPPGSWTPALQQPLVDGEVFDCSDCYARQFVTDPHPHRKYIGLLNYVYDVDFLAGAGNRSGWSYQTGDHIVGFPMLQQDKVYSVEIGVEMNTVNGPFDVYGNGTGQRNGRLLIEVDGVPFLDKTDMLWTHHPEQGFPGIQFDSTLGGQEFPRSVFKHGRVDGPYVIARRRIGPPRMPTTFGGLPQYIQDMSAGQVRAISSNTFADVNPAVLQGPGGPGWDPGAAGGEGIQQYIWRSSKYANKQEGWCSTCYAPNVGAAGSVFIWAGSAEAYHGTEVQRFDFAPQPTYGKWVIPNMSEPTIQMTQPCMGPQYGYAADPLYSQVIYPSGHALKYVGEHGDISTTGAPASTQNYDSILFLPPPWGAPVTGSMLSVCGWAAYGQGVVSWAHMFDLNQTSNGKWKRATTTGHKDQNGQEFVPGSNTSCCIDTKRNVIWFYDGQTGDNRTWISYIDLNTATYPGPWPWKTKLLTNTANLKQLNASFYDATRDGIIVCRTNGNGELGLPLSERLIFMFLDCASVTSPIIDGTADKLTSYTATLSGVTLPNGNIPATGDTQYGTAYVPELGTIFLWFARPGEAMNMYQIAVPANPRTPGVTWNVTKTTITDYPGTTMNFPQNQPGGPGNPMHKRMHYCKELKSIVFLITGAATPTMPVFVYRVPGV